ncbi:unnamed protein product [Closterium sp. NIES-53]
MPARLASSPPHGACTAAAPSVPSVPCATSAAAGAAPVPSVPSVPCVTYGATSSIRPSPRSMLACKPPSAPSAPSLPSVPTVAPAAAGSAAAGADSSASFTSPTLPLPHPSVLSSPLLLSPSAVPSSLFIPLFSSVPPPSHAMCTLHPHHPPPTPCPPYKLLQLHLPCFLQQLHPALPSFPPALLSLYPQKPCFAAAPFAALSLVRYPHQLQHYHWQQ